LLLPVLKKLTTVFGLLERTNVLLGNLITGGMMVEGIRENAQGQDLTDPMLKSLRDKLAAMSPHPTLAARFHKAFVQNYTKLLLFKQKYGNVRVSPAHDEQLANWVKNMKTQLRNMLHGDGQFITDPRYVSYLRNVGITFSDDSGF
jgi:hypothetical protein